MHGIGEAIDVLITFVIILVIILIGSCSYIIYDKTNEPEQYQPTWNCAKDIRICELYTQIDKLEREYDERLADCQKRKISINCYEWARK